MRRVSVLVSALAVLVVVIAGLVAVGRPGRAAAQDASPAAEDGGEGGFEPLAFATFDTLPPAPALVVLFRISYEPGASFPSPAFPGPPAGTCRRGRCASRAPTTARRCG